MKTTLALLALLIFGCPLNQAQAAPPQHETVPGMKVTALSSGAAFAVPASSPHAMQGAPPPSDCALARNVPDPGYSPAIRMDVEITVVFHVMRDDIGNFDVSDDRLMDQVEVMNQCFDGTFPGIVSSVDTGVRFRLATEDPFSNPTTGIIRYDNTNWTNDIGNYWGPTRWDTSRYMNIYVLDRPLQTNVTGYVPFFPASGNAGTPRDRIVLQNTFVANGPSGGVFGEGKEAVLLAGYYLGLYPVWQNGCGSSNCNITGDLICDTAPATFFGFSLNCSPPDACGGPVPAENFMTFLGHSCRREFTEEQARRIRCTLDFWRPTIAVPVLPGPGTAYCTAVPNSTGDSGSLVGAGTPVLANNDISLVASQLPVGSTGYYLVGQQQANTPGAGGSQGTLCLGGPIGRYIDQVAAADAMGKIPLIIDLTAVPQPTGAVQALAGETWNFQCWYRDANPNPTSNFTDGYSVVIR